MTALRTLTSFRLPLALSALRVSRLLDGVALRRMSTSCTVLTCASRSLVAAATASSCPFLKALMSAVDSRARNVRVSSLPGSPHHFGFFLKLMLPFLVSSLSTVYGPAPHSACGLLT
jgi:hypothetical protein